MENLVVKKEISTFLTNIGCCWRCILIFLGETKVENFMPNEIYTNSLSINGEDVKNFGKRGLNTDGSSLDGMSNPSDSAPKKLKTFICLSCLGLLQNCTSTETVCKFSNKIEDEAFDADTFCLGISLPISLGIRIYSIWIHLVKKFPIMEGNPTRVNHLTVLKDVWRSIVGPKIASKINKTFINGQSVCFNLTVHSHYVDDEKDCLLLEKLDEKRFYLRRKQHKKYAEGVFTKQVVEDTLKDFTDEQFYTVCPDLPRQPTEMVSYVQIHCTHSSIYLAGRYNKYSRVLPQTPWFVEEDRRFDSSVQELICNPLNESVVADGIKFSASGREDVDVRCLGRGRPFVIEFVNPRKIKLSSDDLRLLQEEINASTDLVRIKDLQVVSKKDTCNLKEGEEEKTKSYCALCFSADGVTDELLQRVEGISELTLDQMTPLRVLHRRPLSVRKRAIHSISVERVDEHFFKLYMKTQAGTYIKEFIHGDFGRTTPNLGSILGVKCDIIALDVEVGSYFMF